MKEDFPDRIPRNVNQDFGELKVAKGSLGHLNVTMWSVTPDCDPSTCPAASKCGYVEKQETPKCMLQLKYLKRVFQSIMLTHGKKMTDDQMMRAGLTLIPLYSQLVKFKMAELAIVNVTYLNDKGDVKIEPVYAEIRKIITAINQAWKDIFPYARTRDKPALPGDDTLLVDGDPSYYDNLMLDGGYVEDDDPPPRRKKKKGIKRRSKKRKE